MKILSLEHIYNLYSNIPVASHPHLEKARNLKKTCFWSSRRSLSYHHTSPFSHPSGQFFVFLQRCIFASVSESLYLFSLPWMFCEISTWLTLSLLLVLCSDFTFPVRSSLTIKNSASSHSLVRAVYALILFLALTLCPLLFLIITCYCLHYRRQD